MTTIMMLSFTNFVGPIVFLGLILALAALIYFVLYPLGKRKSLRLYFDIEKDEYERINKIYQEKIKYWFYGSNLPQWAIQKIQKAANALTTQRKIFTPDQGFFDAFLEEKNIVVMGTMLKQLTDATHLLKSFVGKFDTIDLEIQNVQNSIEQLEVAIQQELDELYDSLLEYEGYVLQKYNAQYVLLKTEFAQAEILRKSKPSGDKEVESLLKDLLDRLDSLSENLYHFVECRDKADDLLSLLRDRYLALHPMKDAAYSTLASLKQTYPESCWQSEADNLDKVPVLLKEYLSFMKIAQRHNMMSEQNFEFAHSAAKAAEEKLQLMEQFVADIHRCREKIEEAKSNYPLLLTSASKAISAAGVVAKSGGDDVKRLFAQADEMLNKVVPLASKPLVDWFVLADMLVEAKALAEQCTAQTTN